MPVKSSSQQITASLPKDVIQKYKEQAAREDRSFSAVVRRALIASVSRDES